MSKKRSIKGALNKNQTTKVNKMIDSKINKKHQTKERAILIASTAITAGAGLIVPLTAMFGGDDNGERVANDVYPTLLDFYFEWILDPADSTNLCRLTLIHWFDDDATIVPTLGNVFEDTSGSRPLSPFNFNNKGGNRTFSVLFDRIYTVSVSGSQSKASRIKLFGKRLPNEINFNDSASLAGKNKVYIILWSDSTVSGPSFKLNGVFKYKN